MANIKTDMKDLIERATLVACKSKENYDKIISILHVHIIDTCYILSTLKIECIKVYFNDTEYVLLKNGLVALGCDIYGTYTKYVNIEDLEMLTSRLVKVDMALVKYIEELISEKEQEYSDIENIFNQKEN